MNSKETSINIIIGVIIGAILGIAATFFILGQRTTKLETQIEQLKNQIKQFNITKQELEEQALLDPHRYGIRITSPRQGESVGERATRISGTFGVEVPKMRTQLFIIGDGPQYWPQDVVEFDTVNRKWHGYVYIGGNPPQDVTVMVALVGNSGCILSDYYKKVVKETGNILYEKFGKKESLYLALDELSDDILECDRIQLRRQ